MALNGEAVKKKIKDAQKRVVDFWKKYDKKQKTLIISITLIIAVALGIMAFVLSRTTYKELITCENTLAAAEVKSALSDGGYKYRVKNNGLTFEVDEKQLNDATYAIAQGGYTASGYEATSIKDALGGGFSTTSADKDRLYQKYLEDKMKAVLEDQSFVKEAKVTFYVPADPLSLLDNDEETSVAVTLKLNKTVPDGAGVSMANYIAAAVGNKTTNNVIIIDNQGNTIFQGSSETKLDGSSASEREKIYALYTDQIVDNVTKLVARIPEYQGVSVSPSLKIDFTEVDIKEDIKSNPDLVKNSDYVYEMTGGSVSGGVPGTDSNDNDTTYTISPNPGSTTELSIKKNDYAVSTTITNKDGVRGTFVEADSRVGIVLTQYIVYNEDEVRSSGQLGDLSWEEFQAANGNSKKIDVDASVVDVLKAASIDNINVVAYQVPMFNSSTSEGKTFTDYLPIILAVVILALLAFVLWRSLRPVEVTEVDAGLSVDDLLTATHDAQKVEDIDLNEKSEVRKAIEKFVDENPEAVAALLRNWLNDDWN